MTAEDEEPAIESDGGPTEENGRPTGSLERTSPPADAPVDPAVCAYCGSRFVDEQLLALHRGLEHGPELDEGEREAYAEAVATERDDLRLFRLQALAALLVIYFGFVIVYAFVL